MILLIVSCSIAVFVSAACSLAESVLLTLNPIRLQSLKNEGARSAGTWLRMKRNVGRPIAAILILNTVAHTGGATVAGAAFDELYGEKWIWLFSTVFTLVVLFGTEIVPKLLGVAHAERLAPLVAPPLQFATMLLRPVIWFTELFSKRFARVQQHAEITVSDILTLASMARAGKVIGIEQEAIIENALRIHRTKVKDVMIPREQIDFFRKHLPMEENLRHTGKVLHTRYPVSETDDPDGIIGFINLKRMLAISPDLEEMLLTQAMIQPLLSVRKEMTLLELSRLLAVRKEHMALVRDTVEGRITGLVTLEDVVGEVMGYE